MCNDAVAAFMLDPLPPFTVTLWLSLAFLRDGESKRSMASVAFFATKEPWVEGVGLVIKDTFG